MSMVWKGGVPVKHQGHGTVEFYTVIIVKILICLLLCESFILHLKYKIM